MEVHERRIGGIEADDVTSITGLFRSAAGGTKSVPGDDGPCPANN